MGWPEVVVKVAECAALVAVAWCVVRVLRGLR
jgi:hypothetical protein